MTPRRSELYRDSAGEVILRRSVVAFVDVLGVRALSTGPDAADQARRLDQALAAASSRFFDEHPYTKLIATAWFTDHVVAAWPFPDAAVDTEAELGTLLNFISWFQFDLALHGFFVRGGVAVGDVAVTQRFAFGPALIEAVDLEQRAAHPRVVLSLDAIAEIAEHVGFYSPQTDAPQGTALATDETDAVFTNYLPTVVGDLDDGDDPGPLVAGHRDAVKAALEASTDPRVRDKLRWLAAYHNHYAHRGLPGAPQLVIRSTELAPDIKPLHDSI